MNQLRDREDHQSKESEYDLPCGCDSGIRKTPDYSKEYGDRFIIHKRS